MAIISLHRINSIYLFISTHIETDKKQQYDK